MNVPLLIELHRTCWNEDKNKLWDDAFMVDICHIGRIEPVFKAAGQSIEEMRAHKPVKSYAVGVGYGLLPNCRLFTDGTEVGVIETYDEIREKIAKAGVMIP